MKLTTMTMAAVLLPLGLAASPAFAQDAPAHEHKPPNAVEEEQVSGPFDIAVNFAVVSDYRFRGVSLSDKDFAFQPSITVSHESGIYVGVWASNVAPNAGDDVEVDLYAGFAGGDALTYDIGATYYVYPGASGLNYYEFIGKLGTTVGPATLGATIGYVPSQSNLGNRDNIYLGTNVAVGLPGTPLTLTASIGYDEGGVFGTKKTDWSLGATATVQGFTIGASYVDSNRFLGGLAGAGAVFSISYGF